MANVKIFLNTNNVPEMILTNRLARYDPAGTVHNYDADILDDFNRKTSTVHYSAVTSILTDEQINAGLGQITAAEIAAIARQINAQDNARTVTQLKSVTAAQALAAVNNITDLASAKTILGQIVQVLVAVRDQLWPNLPDS